MIAVEYICQTCGRRAPEDSRSMICLCGGHLLGKGGPSVCGTRDGFGIRNEFQDDNSGKVIDNWKSWEKAGYRNPVETTKNHTVKEKVKEKIKKVKKQ